MVLTALAAILAMIPLARRSFWGPMAMTIMGGLLVATILTLLVVPALYALWFRVKEEEPGGVTAENVNAAPAVERKAAVSEIDAKALAANALADVPVRIPLAAE